MNCGPRYWLARCPECGWTGTSDQAAGGEPIADTGDYGDVLCPACIAPGGDYEKGKCVAVEEVESVRSPAGRRE